MVDKPDLRAYRFELLRQVCDLGYYRAIGLQRELPTFIVARAMNQALEQSAALQLQNEFALNHLIQPQWAIKALHYDVQDAAAMLLYPHYTAEPLHCRVKGQLALGKFFAVALRLVASLKGLHQSGLVHKDVKPSNILIDDDSAVYFTNFGVAQQINDIEQTATAPVFKCTLAYISPEHSGFTEHKIDQRSDLYSLGVILYELLTGRLPIELSESAAASEWIHCHLVSELKSPHILDFNIPLCLAQLILKLLAKSPALRYQSAALLEEDLLFCSKSWHDTGQIAAFPLGEGYHSSGFDLSDALLQRDSELAALHNALELARLGQKPTLVFIWGLAGIGKSALLKRFSNEIKFNGSCVAYAKALQYKRNTPYAILIGAFRQALLQLLQSDAEELADWQQRLQDAPHLGSELALRTFPELVQLGAQLPQEPLVQTGLKPDLTEQLEPLLRALICTFSSTARPFILLLDDIHWLDEMSISLLNQLLGQNPPFSFLLIVTQCDDKASRPGPRLSVSALQHAVSVLHLQPLDVPSVRKLLASSFRSNQPELLQLADLIHAKTLGCPFFVKYLLKTLFAQGLIRLDPTSGMWRCEYSAIADFAYTENVAQDVTRQFASLGSATQQLLIAMSVVGISVQAELIDELFIRDKTALQDGIQAAVSIGILRKTTSGYAFLHHVVHATIKALASASQQIQLHLQIGRRLLSLANDSHREEFLSHATEHLCQVPPLHFAANERADLVPLLLEVAQKAKTTQAITFAKSILSFIYQLASQPPAGQEQWLASILLEQAECELISGQLAAVQPLLLEVIQLNAGLVQTAQAYRFYVELLLRQSNYQAAVNVALAGLQTCQIDIPASPSLSECDLAYEQLMGYLGDKPTTTLMGLARLNNQAVEAQMALLSSLSVPASFTCANLHFVQLIRVLILTLEHGMSGASTAALGWFGVLVAERYGQYTEGFAFCQLARSLVAEHQFKEYEAKTLLTLDQVSVWSQPLSFSIECVNAGFSAAISHGDLATACFECCHQVANLFTLGAPLNKVLSEIERGLLFSQKVGFDDVRVIMLVQQAFVENLHFNKQEALSGQRFLVAVQASIDGDMTERMSTLVFWFWLYKGISHYLADEITDAAASLTAAGRYAWSAPAHIHLLDYHFYSALTIAAGGYTAADKPQARVALLQHYQKISVWAATNPATFKDKALIVEGELARFDHQPFKAMSLFERAIAGYHNHDFIQYRAIAHELAAKLALQHQQLTNARAQIEQAMHCFGLWAAQGKVQQLRCTYTGLNIVQAQNEHGVLLATESKSERYLTAMLKVTRLMTESYNDEQILRDILSIVLEQAAAQRGLLVSLRGQIPIIETRAETTPEGLTVETMAADMGPLDAPLTMLNACFRAQKHIHIEQIQGSPYELDIYWQHLSERGAICLPIIAHHKQLGVLYLEYQAQGATLNDDYFSALNLLAAKAALVIEMAQLRENFSESVSKHSQVERSHQLTRASLNLGEKISKMGSWHWDLDSDIITCSAEMCHIFGLDPNNNKRTFQSFFAFFHPEDQAYAVEKITKAVAHHNTFDVDHRITRRDGTTLYLNGQGSPVFGQDGLVDYVGTISDISSRRAAEDALRIAQEDLARVSRINTVGQLTSSIAHEINQPLMSIVSHAAAGIRWLNRASPNLDEVTVSMLAIAGEGQRAGQIVEGIRNLTRNIKPKFTRVNLHNIVTHVLTIVRSEAVHKNVAIKLHFAANQHDIEGDPVQLQQVVLNILMNAIEAMAEVHDRSRILHVYTRNQTAQSIEIKFEDSGPGISPEVSKRLFDAFYTTKKDGMGMGLAICQSILKIHQGQLIAEPTETIGSVFTIILPLIKE